MTFGFLLGAGTAYFGDRARGRQRRAKLRDWLASALRRERALLDKAVRDAGYRVHGALERVRHPQDDSAAPDPVIVGRVRAQLGRIVTHTHAIEATSDGGVVRLRGPILEVEADPAVRAVSRVPGVRDVIDELERHGSAERIPALQGGGRRRGSPL
ncbi:MAG TPA: BON domain-containing protein, partial [Kofleriaceae bacterium]